MRYPSEGGEAMIELLRFLRVALAAYWACKAGGGTYYGAVVRHGVPEVAIFVGVGREAWRISQRAIEEAEI